MKMSGSLEADERRGGSVLWLALALEGVALAAITRFGDFSVHGNALWFVTVFLTAGAGYLLAVSDFSRVARLHRPLAFWGVAILFRLMVFPLCPGDDLWRYLWEGKIQLYGLNPYLLCPNAPSLESLRDPAWQLINFRDWAAVYPPGAQLLFAALAQVSVSPFLFKAVFGLADLMTIGLLVRINTGPGRYRASAWYAWNPAVICFFTGAGHFDSLLLFTTTAAIWALYRANPLEQGAPARGWALLSALFLGLAISIKMLPIFLLPVWFFGLWEGAARSESQRPGDVLSRLRSVVRRLFLPCAAVLVSLAVPFLLAQVYGGIRVVMEPMQMFAEVARFNDFFWWISEQTLWANPRQINTYYGMITMAVLGLLAVWFRKDWRRGVLWVAGTALLLSPMVHPWYVTWILPIACWRKQRAWFILSLSVVVSLLVWEAGPFWMEWEMSIPLRAMVCLPPLAGYFYLRKQNRIPTQ